MVIGLFYTVAHWNEYFHAMIYLNDTSKWPLQVLLREFAIVGDRGSMVSYQNIIEWGDATQIDIRRMRATIIFITLFRSPSPIAGISLPASQARIGQQIT